MHRETGQVLQVYVHSVAYYIKLELSSTMNIMCGLPACQVIYEDITRSPPAPTCSPATLGIAAGIGNSRFCTADNKLASNPSLLFSEK